MHKRQSRMHESKPISSLFKRTMVINAKQCISWHKAKQSLMQCWPCLCHDDSMGIRNKHAWRFPSQRENSCMQFAVHFLRLFESTHLLCLRAPDCRQGLVDCPKKLAFRDTLIVGRLPTLLLYNGYPYIIQNLPFKFMNEPHGCILLNLLLASWEHWW
jgi:hypothetical protein